MFDAIQFARVETFHNPRITRIIFTQCKQSRAIVKRKSRSNQTIVLGLELDRRSWKGTGKCHLMIIPKADRKHIELAICAHVSRGATVWTDEAKVYQWMDKTNSGYLHDLQFFFTLLHLFTKLYQRDPN